MLPLSARYALSAVSETRRLELERALLEHRALFSRRFGGGGAPRLWFSPGRVNLMELDCPFRAADRLLETLTARPPIAIVDMHAEATSEKVAMGWYLDGRVSAVVGTHTHIPTADARLLPGGAAYVTDVGMVGPHNSVIGVQVAPVIQHFLTRLPARFEVADGPVVFNAVLIEVDAPSGRAQSIQRIDRLLPDQT